MQTIITNDAGIHCKVSCNDQFRRFLFIGTEFSSLFAQIQQLLSLNKEFVLKYKDNEGDLITISSNEELACALSYSEGSVLRLTASSTDSTTDSTTDSRQREPATTEFPCHFYGRRHGGKCHGRGGRYGRFAQDPDAPRNGPECFKARLTFKRDKIQSRLAEFAQSGELDPNQQYRQAMLKEKLGKIEAHLAKLEEGCSRWEKRSSKWEAKAEKHKNKHMEKQMKKEKHGHSHYPKEKREKVVLSEETQARIAALKSQIVALKPSYKEVKYQIKAKKAAMKEAKSVGGNTEQLSNEISKLKEVRQVQKNAIKPIKEQIYALKHTC
jgi:hypothetical protein